MNAKLVGKLVLLGFGLVLILMGANSLLTQPGAQCITIFIFPLGCYTPNAFGWIGGLITALIGVGVLILGLRV